MGKRIVLFLAVNFLVIITISLVFSLLGVDGYITKQGLDYGVLLIFCGVWGMGGAFISLGLSRITAKWMMKVKVIEADTQDPGQQQLLQMVARLAQSANLPMPEVGYYQSPEMNAFATGPTRNRALVAVSTGLLQRMNTGEVEGVLGHEIAHVANGDMVTMTLIQGVINAFVMFLARVVAFAITQALARGRDSQGINYLTYWLVTMALEMVFMIAGSMVVMWFSRWREFRADAGGAQFAGRENMVGALKALQGGYEDLNPKGNAAFQSMQISGRSRGSLARLFSSHPPLEDRIQRLEHLSG